MVKFGEQICNEICELHEEGLPQNKCADFVGVSRETIRLWLNKGKNAKKMAKRKAQQEKLAAYASMNTKKINSNSSNSSNSKPVDNRSQYEKRVSDISKKANNVSSKDSPSSSSSGGGMMAKANAVKNFNEKNNK